MSNESLQRSVLPNSPVDPSIVRVLCTLDPIARDAGCAYFVAGATARDLILVNIHGLRLGRATRDIDFGPGYQVTKTEVAILRFPATGALTANPDRGPTTSFCLHLSRRKRCAARPVKPPECCI